MPIIACKHGRDGLLAAREIVRHLTAPGEQGPNADVFMSDELSPDIERFTALFGESRGTLEYCKILRAPVRSRQQCGETARRGAGLSGIVDPGIGLITTIHGVAVPDARVFVIRDGLGFEIEARRHLNLDLRKIVRCRAQWTPCLSRILAACGFVPSSILSLASDDASDDEHGKSHRCACERVSDPAGPCMYGTIHD